MNSKFSNAIAGGEGSVRGPGASRGFRSERGGMIPKFRKGTGQKNNRKRKRAEFNELQKDRRELQAMLKRPARSYERSGADFEWNAG